VVNREEIEYRRLLADQLDLLLYPPAGPVSPVAVRLAAAGSAGLESTG
jgi:hypothetical protein